MGIISLLCDGPRALTQFWHGWSQKGWCFVRSTHYWRVLSVECTVSIVRQLAKGVFSPCNHSWLANVKIIYIYYNFPSWLYVYLEHGFCNSICWTTEDIFIFMGCLQNMLEPLPKFWVFFLPVLLCSLLLFVYIFSLLLVLKFHC